MVSQRCEIGHCLGFLDCVNGKVKPKTKKGKRNHENAEEFKKGKCSL